MSSSPLGINFSLNAQKKHWENRFVIVVGDVVTLQAMQWLIAGHY